jgi:hypothetical protein
MLAMTAFADSARQAMQLCQVLEPKGPDLFSANLSTSLRLTFYR